MRKKLEPAKTGGGDGSRRKCQNKNTHSILLLKMLADLVKKKNTERS